MSAVLLAFCAAAASAGEAPQLRVRVLFGDRPAPLGTEVRLFEPSMLCGSAQFRVAPLRLTDAEGWVSFEHAAPDSSLRAETPALGWVSGKAEGRVVTLVFPPGSPIRGQVLEDDGQPSPGANVHLVPKTSGTTRGELVSSNRGTTHLAVRAVRADAAGRFELLGLPEGRYAVVADRDDHVLGPAVEVAAGTTDVVVRQAPHRQLEGSVVERDGGAVPAARVVVTLSKGATRSSSDQLNEPRGPYSTLFEAPPTPLNPPYYAQSAQTDEHGHFSMPVAATGPFQALVVQGCLRWVAPLEGASPLRLVVPPVSVITGEVLVPPGQGADDILVWAGQDADPCRAERTVVDGGVAFQARGTWAGPVEVEVRTADFASVRRAVKVRPGAPPTRVHLRLAPRRAPLDGGR